MGTRSGASDSQQRENDRSKKLFPDPAEEKKFKDWCVQKNAYLDAFDRRGPAEQRILFAYVVYQHEQDRVRLLQTVAHSKEQREGIKTRMKQVIVNAMYLAKFEALLPHAAETVARIQGGQKTAETLKAAKEATHEKIFAAEKRLVDTCKPHQLTKKIAQVLNLAPDYVRKARKLKKKRLAAS